MLKRFLPFALLLISALGHAQEAPPAKQMVLGKMIFYAFAKEVREELKLTEKQIAKMTDAFQGTLQVEGDRIMITMDPSLDMDDIEKQAMKILEEGQRKRLEEIWIQELGAISIVEDSIAKALKLSDEQKKAVQKVLEDTAKEMMDLFMAGHDDDAGKKAKALREKASEKAKGLLTEDQAKALEEMKGKSFKRKKDKDGGKL